MDGNEQAFWIQGDNNRIGCSAYLSSTTFSVEGRAEVNGSEIVTEDRLKSIIEMLLEAKEQNELLKKFSKSLMERLYPDEIQP